MWRGLCVALWALFHVAQAGAAAAPPKPPTIRLEVAAKTARENGTALTITLSNAGDQVLKFSTGAGPWSGEGQIKLVAIRLPSGLAVPNEQQAMIDPQLGPMELQPGESRTYEVPLSRLYPELAQELEKQPDAEYVLFWTYQLITWDSVRANRLAGWLPIPVR